MKTRLLLIAVLSQCFFSSDCRMEPAAMQNFHPNGKMVFVEDADGIGGLFSFDFGDIIIFDPTTRTKMRLTDDKYYDTHPYWSADGRKIIFESKRIDTTRDGIFDLTDDSHLFIIDISSKRVEQFDKRF